MKAIRSWTKKGKRQRDKGQPPDIALLLGGMEQDYRQGSVQQATTPTISQEDSAVLVEGSLAQPTASLPNSVLSTFPTADGEGAGNDNRRIAFNDFDAVGTRRPLHVANRLTGEQTSSLSCDTDQVYTGSVPQWALTLPQEMPSAAPLYSSPLPPAVGRATNNDDAETRFGGLELPY